MTEQFSMFPELEDFISVLLETKDDAAAVLVGSAIVDRSMIDLLDSRMPHRTKRIDPLKFDGLPLSLGVTAKWAYALGLIDKGIYDGCTQLQKIRNNAAHLKSGPKLELATLPEKGFIDSGIKSIGATQESVDAYVKIYGELNLNKYRILFDYLAMALLGNIDKQRMVLSKT